ncbi:Phospholipase/Carboxylesterase domain-containing protein [Trichoderma barbatum]
MWHLVQILIASRLWFSDGNPIEASRGGHGVSSRLIVDGQGFLDVTEIRSLESVALDANGATLWLKRHEGASDRFACPSLQNSSYPLHLSLRVDDGGNFNLTLVNIPDVVTACYGISKQVSGRLMPLPAISAKDAAFISSMIEQKFMPYQNITDAPTRPIQEIRALGRQFFPFTPHHFELAMCLYDWTTPSFSRLVLFKIFQYTGIDSGIAALPHPLDRESLALNIWQSNFSVYTPQDADYMRAFLMQPAHSLDNLTAQLEAVIDEVYKFSEIENRLLTIAMESMPRTSVASKPRLFSGQVDMEQLGTDRFGIEFDECPLNEGPVGVELAHSLTDALASYVSVGSTITTKMAWSFTDNMEDAMHYANGIVLVLNPSSDEWLWDSVSFVTPLSDDPVKIEYTAAPGTKFEIQSVQHSTISGTSVTIIGLEPVSKRNGPLKVQTTLGEIRQKGHDTGLLAATAANHRPQTRHAKGATKSRHDLLLHLEAARHPCNFTLMPSFSFSRTVVSGFTLAALIAIALAILPSFLGLDLSGLLEAKPAGLAHQIQTQTQTQPETQTDTLDAMASLARAAPLVFPALGRHTATVIFVHGLGDTGSGWADAVQMWQKKHRLDEVKFVLPNARIMPITVNQGYPMPAWFDIKNLGGSTGQTLDGRSRREDEAGILESRAYLYSLIQQEVFDGISSERIVLGGFSQGGAMSIFSGLTAPFKLGGVVGLSSWMLLSHKFKEFVPEANLNKETPIFMGHGDADQLVLYEWGVATEQKLKEFGYDVKLETYEGMQHSACMEEFDDVESFLVSRLASGNA